MTSERDSTYCSPRPTAPAALASAPDEPTGAWALVLDGDGRPWVRHLADGIYKDRWKAVGFSGHYPWDTLVERAGPLTVVFAGEPPFRRVTARGPLTDRPD